MSNDQPLYRDVKPWEPPTAEELEAWCKLDPNTLGPVGALARCARRVRELEKKLEEQIDECIRLHGDPNAEPPRGVLGATDAVSAPDDPAAG